MNKKIAFVFVVVGLALFVLGSCAYHSMSGDVSRALTGGSNDAALAFIIGGLLAAITGVFGFDSDHSEQS
jgi:hypothetical protein